jgi:hypothetical protein
VVVSLVVLGAVVAGYRARAVPDGAVLRVGGAVVTEEQFATRATLLTVLYRVTPPPDPAGLTAYRQAVARAVAVSTVLEQQAQARGITISDPAVADRVDDLITTSFPDGADAFAARLASVGLSERDVAAEVRRQLATARLFDLVTEGVAAPADGDVVAAARRLARPPDEWLRLALRTEHRQDTWLRWLGDSLRSADVHYAKSYQPADADTITPDTAGIGLPSAPAR